MGLQYQSSNLDDASDQTSQASMVAEQDRGPSIEAQSQDAARLATELHHIVEEMTANCDVWLSLGNYACLLVYATITVWASSGKDDQSIHPELLGELLKTIRAVIQFAKVSSARRPFFRTLLCKREQRKIASYKARFVDILKRLGGVVTSIDEAVKPILLQNEAILTALNRYRPQAGMATSTGPPPLAPPQFTQSVTKIGGRGWGGRPLEGGQMNLLGRGAIGGLHI